MKQRLSKLFICVTMAVAVVLAQPMTAFASDVVSIGSDDNLLDDGILSFNASDGSGADITDLIIIHSGFENPYAQYTYQFEWFVPSMAQFTLEGGYVYNGTIRYKISFNFQDVPDFGIGMRGFKDFNVASSSSNMGISISDIEKISFDYSQNGSYYVNVTVNDLYVSSDTTYYITANTSWTASALLSQPLVDHQYYVGVINYPSTDFVTDGWTRSVPGESNLGGVVSDSAQQQMQQQQQIADQQAAQQDSIAAAQSQQSAEQHDELVNGYDNSAAESGQAEFDSALSDFESQEAAILDDAMANINAVDMDTSVFDQLVPTFEFIRIVFMSLVTAMGDFGVLITITLSICLALFAIGWFRS